MRVVTRVTVAFVCLVTATAAVLGFWNYRAITRLVFDEELSRLRVHTELLARELTDAPIGASTDILALSVLPALGGVLGDDGRVDTVSQNAPNIDWHLRVGRVFSVYLRVKPQYLKFRLIGVENDGRELVRAERDAEFGPIRIVPEEELQTMGHRDYFQAAIALPPDETYVSPIYLSRESDEVGVPHVPVIHIACPVYGDGTDALAILVVTIDMRAAFERLREAGFSDGRVYVINSNGDYLMHPDPSREYGFDLGTPYTIHDEFPEIASAIPLVGSYAQALPVGAEAKVGVASSSVQLAGGPTVCVIEMLPESVLIAASESIRNSSLIAAGIAALAAILAAVFVARSVTRPLGRITSAAKAFGSGEETNLPSNAPGEIGILSRAFDRMATDIGDRTSALKQEIERRKRTESELELYIDQIRLYRAIVESTDDAIISNTLGGEITGWNLAAERLFGYSAKEALGKRMNMIVPEDRLSEARDFLNRAAKGQAVRRIDTVRTRKDGSPVDVALTVSPIRSGSGEILGASTIARDISELRASEDLIRLAVESSPSGMVMIDRSGKILMVNAQTERLFRYHRDELLGKHIEILIPERFQPNHPEMRYSYFENPVSREMGQGRDLYGRKSGGREFPVEIGLNPTKAASGTVVLASIIDITKRKEIEHALQARADEVERSNRELERFAHVVSHDLQETLQIISSNTSLIAERYGAEDDREGKECIEHAVEGAARMKALVDDLLKFSRVGAEGKPLEPTDANRVLEQVLAELSGKIRGKEAEILHEPMPMVLADPDQLGQVFAQLIDNALKFSAPDRPIRVRISAQQRDIECTIVIEDNGIGIDPADSDRVFQVFQRLHTRTAYEGSGIGLAVAKKIVARHGGKIWLESEGAGTTFYFTLKTPETPAQDAASDSEEQSNSVTDESSQAASQPETASRLTKEKCDTSD